MPPADSLACFPRCWATCTCLVQALQDDRSLVRKRKVHFCHNTWSLIWVNDTIKVLMSDLVLAAACDS